MRPSGPIALLVAALVLFGGPAHALDLALPSNARETAQRVTQADSYAAPVGVYRDGALPTVALEGEVRRKVWRIPSPGLTTLQVLDPLRTQLLQAGWDVVLDCDARSCGGFDFRFAIEVLPAPNMYVNLRAYRFITALRGAPDSPGAAVTVLVSTTPTDAFVQVISVTGTDARVAAEPGAAPIVQASSLSDALLADGHAVLDGLDFATGSTALGAGPFPSLEALARLLRARPGLQVALVGHTDSVGDLDTNITLSRARAASVRDRLVRDYGIGPARLRAEGMGYLAPVGNNLNAAGREANRRVEVVLLAEN